MKNRILFIAMLAFAAFVTISCDDESTEGMTRITYYAKLTLEGDKTLKVDKGTEFVDPGYSAIMEGEDVTDMVEVFSNVNTEKSGVYNISYAIVNKDGFYSTANRTVIVTDPNDPVEGLYETDPEKSYRLYGDKTPYGASFDILILNNGDGTYSVDDLLGGWYCQRAGYGSDYAMEGTISVDADGNITMIESYVPGWGDWATGMTDGKVTGRTITWNVEYTDYPFFFIVTMYKK